MTCPGLAGSIARDGSPRYWVAREDSVVAIMMAFSFDLIPFFGSFAASIFSSPPAERVPSGRRTGGEVRTTTPFPGPTAPGLSDYFVNHQQAAENVTTIPLDHRIQSAIPNASRGVLAARQASASAITVSSWRPGGA